MVRYTAGINGSYCSSLDSRLLSIDDVSWIPGQDSIYWIPTFSLLATASINFFQYRFWKILTSIVLITIAGYQFVVAYSIEPEYVDGYEEAAKYVVENRKGESVLYQEIKDTGYFIFFVQKHDPKQDLIVLQK